MNLMTRNKTNILRAAGVILTSLFLGLNVSESVNVTLADRSRFKYKLLIGRNLLYDNFIVDVSQKYTIDPMEHKEE
ncbi:MAG: RimK/LysX family protein [Sulfurimonas sp.]